MNVSVVVCVGVVVDVCVNISVLAWVCDYGVSVRECVY